MEMKIYTKPILVGCLLMFLLSIPVGFIVVQVQEYFLSIYGLSYEHSNIDQIEGVLSKYDFHPYIILSHVFSSLVTVSIPSYVSANLAKSSKILHGMIVGVFSVLLFLYWGNMDDTIFVLFVVSLDVIASLLGAFLAKETKETGAGLSGSMGSDSID